MKKFFVLFSIFFALTGCSFIGDTKYLKKKIVGVSNVKTQEEVENKSSVNSKKIKIDGVKREKNIVYSPVMGYGSIPKEERLSYADNTDNSYGLFEYRFYYDYSIPDTIFLLIDVDAKHRFISVTDETNRNFEITKGWEKNTKKMLKETVRYVELYTISLPFEYIEQRQEDRAIVLNLQSDNKFSFMDNLFLVTDLDRSRTFHIPQYYIKGFLNAIQQKALDKL